MMDQPQRGILVVTFDELVRLLNLPAGHYVERISVSEDRYFPPGLLITVSGPMMPLYYPGSPLYAEDYEQAMAHADERVAAAAKYRERGE